MADRFFIAPDDSGLITAVKPFAIPDTAYAELDNAYVWRGRVKKRFGSEYMQPTTALGAGYRGLQSRFRIKVGTTLGDGSMVATAIAGAPAGLTIAVGQAISIGERIWTVTGVGGPNATLISTFTTSTPVTLVIATKTIAVVATFALALQDVYFYPALPVMGLITYQNGGINDFPTIGFDTRFSYEYGPTGWERIGTGAAATWTGTDVNLFWGATWRGVASDSTSNILFVTNNVAADGIRYWDSATWTKPTFNNLAASTIQTALIIVPFKNRLVLLSTTENNKIYQNRARFCQNGSPLGPDAWREDVVGRGGWIDAPTQERIITAQLLRDRLIVYFEESTWELVYTENPVLPFIWQQLNAELGSQSTFSVIPFDTEALAIGYNGVHACNGVNVQRIDNKIPNQVYDISNENNGPIRTYGIRDYYAEMAYWTMPLDRNKATNASIYPNAVLCYNYQNQTWSINDDSITCFGYFRQQATDTWETTLTAWEDMDAVWDSATQALRFKNIIAGNQQGYVFVIRPENVPGNAQVLQITNMVSASDVVTITCINHNLRVGDWIYIADAQPYFDPSAPTSLAVNFQVESVTDADTFTINDDPDAPYFTATYLGGGTIGRVSQINISTKQFNFYQKQGRQFAISKVDFLVDKTISGEITIDSYINTSPDLAIDSVAMETSPYTLVPQEQDQNQLWHTTYPPAQGSYIQLNLYLSDTQLESASITQSDFQLHAMCFTANSTSSRLQ